MSNPKFNTIIRTFHNEQNPYVQLNKETLWSDRLSLKATGLWARCMSRPNNWSFNISELADKCKEGRRAIDSAMRELMSFGLVCRFEYSPKSEKGQFTSRLIEYVFFENPINEEEKVFYYEEFKKFHRDCGFGNCRNSKLPKTKTQTKTDSKKVNDRASPSLTPSKKEGKKEKPPAQKGHVDKKSSDYKGRAKYTEEQKKALEWLTSLDLDTSHDTLSWWSRNYPIDRLKAVYNESRRRNPGSIGAYMHKLLKKGAILCEGRVNDNRQFAEDFKKSHSWGALNIHQKYAILNTGCAEIEIDFNMEPLTFVDYLFDKFEHYGTLR